jgi:dienelactone hydrolase
MNKIKQMIQKSFLKKLAGTPVNLLPKPYEYVREDVECVSVGLKLRGYCYLPKKEGKLKTIIISHGFGSSKLFETSVGISFAKAGYAAYTFDFAGGSYPGLGSSEGDVTKMSVLTEKQNLLDILAYVKNRPETDLKNIFLEGESQGGFVTTITAPEILNDINSIVLFFPAYIITTASYDRYPQGVEIPETYSVLRNTIGRVYDLDCRKVSVYDEMKKINKPVLIIHGDKDKLVPVNYSKLALTCFPSASLEVLKGEDHGFSNKGRQKAIRLAYSFTESHLLKD